MGKLNDYYYKGYDITSKNSLEKKVMEYANPYGYNLESNSKRVIDEKSLFSKTNQDIIKNKEIPLKK